MFGRWITGLIVIALAIGVWVLWPRGDTSPTTTTVQAAPTTTTTDPTTTTGDVTTTTGAVGSTDVIETVEEAEAILLELWFGWFEGIYNQDEERIKEVVASQSRFEAATSAFGEMTFDAPPTISAIHLSGLELLRADETCTAVWGTLTVDFRAGVSTSVQVLRWTLHGWRTVSSWVNRNDLWENDCDAQLDSLP